MIMKVCKFGGTSMASAKTIGKVVDIIIDDDSRKYIVVSAPGKRDSKDDKITDLLYNAWNVNNDGGDVDSVFKKIEERFCTIAKELVIDFDIERELDTIKRNIKAGFSRAYAASRGEYLSAKILSSKMGIDFVDVEDIIKFDEHGDLRLKLTLDLISKKLSGVDKAILPGFYGTDCKGEIVTFSRGGSDITGALIAAALNADLYENWTDVDGFLVADPRIVENPAYIDYLSYKELRELSYMGAEVMHPESISPVNSAGIAINIKNTFNPSHPGTMIVATKDLPEDTKIITGVAGKKGLTIINIEKDLMNSEVGFGRRVLSVLEEENINFEHVPSGIDTLSVVISDDYVVGRMQRIISTIQERVNADSIEIHSGLSLIAVVGHNMRDYLGCAAKILKPLAEYGVQVRMLDLGSSEFNMIIGVNTTEYEKAINAIYHEFY